jgi:adenine specific DNA methylase Mod
MDIYSNILRPMQKRNEITFRNLITWDKKTGQGQNSEGFRMYAIADEKCLFCQCGVQAQNPNQDQYWDKVEPLRAYLEEQRNKCGWDIPTMKTIAGHSDLHRDHWTGKSQWSLIPEYVYKKFQAWAKEHKIEAFTRPYQSLKDEYERLCAYFNNTHDNMNNVWHFDRTSAEEREGLDHATPKPLALCARGIKTSSREAEIVLDVFGGSGSTMIACEQLGRKCRMMELDPHYCTVIIARWEKLTGQKAVKLNK